MRRKTESSPRAQIANGNPERGPVPIPPPLLYLAALAAGIALHHFFPLALLPRGWDYAVGAVLVAVSVSVIPSILMRFRRARTPLDVRKPATALIADGPFRFSRNPIYVSMTLLYAGLAFFLGNGWVLIFAVPVLLVMNFWVVRREERHLEAKFGEDYLHYKRTVRRWL